MALSNYGLLTGRLTEDGLQAGGNPHYLLVVQAGAISYRVSLNVQSTAPHGDVPATLQYLVLDKLAGSKLAKSIANRNEFVLRDLDPSRPSLDYIRDGIVDMNSFADLESRISLEKNAFYKKLSAACAKGEGKGRCICRGFWHRLSGSRRPSSWPRAQPPARFDRLLRNR
jgi:hypothetical protein